MSQLISASYTGNSKIDALLRGVKWDTNTIEVDLDYRIAYESINEIARNFISIKEISNLSFNFNVGTSSIYVRDANYWMGRNLSVNIIKANHIPNQSIVELMVGNNKKAGIDNNSISSVLYTVGVYSPNLAYSGTNFNDSAIFHRSSIDVYDPNVPSPLSDGVLERSYDTYGLMTSLMRYDIAAVQSLYGANYTTNSENTTYSWDPTTGARSVNGVAETARTDSKIFSTLWDGGGVDTYDLSRYTTNLQLNLNPGVFSTFSASQLVDANVYNAPEGNVANAFLFNNDTRSLIENATGGSGNDSIVGNQANNVLIGGAGNDTLYGMDGNDSLWGGYGTDVLIGGIGDDALYGMDGNDSLWGGDGTDTLVGGLGDDTLYGMDGIDSLWGGDGKDVLVSGEGASSMLDGGNGDDSLWGGIGIDYMVGGDGKDVLVGGGGRDSLYGGAGDDTLIASGATGALLDGGAGDDTFWGSIGIDYMVGGDGNDSLVGGGGQDSLYGGAGNDTLIASGMTGALLDGGAGANTLWGGEGSDTCIGGEGTDSIMGGGGVDTIIANDGDDAIYAGAGGDVIYGGAGNDFIWTDGGGVQSTDTIFAGSGTDTIADFTAGDGDTRDVLAISTTTGLSSYADVMASAVNSDNYAVLNLGAGNHIYLYGVNTSQLTGNNFVFV